MNVSRTADFKLGLFSLLFIRFVSITLLLFAGGFTTSIKAGMAFLDWPLSNGSINPEGWLTETDKFAEHSHRLLGMQIGLISWAWCFGPFCENPVLGCEDGLGFIGLGGVSGGFL